MTLKPFIVWWTEPNDTELQGFKCQAEDAEHAMEQCANAYPWNNFMEPEEVQVPSEPPRRGTPLNPIAWLAFIRWVAVLEHAANPRRQLKEIVNRAKQLLEPAQ